MAILFIELEIELIQHSLFFSLDCVWTWTVPSTTTAVTTVTTMFTASLESSSLITNTASVDSPTYCSLCRCILCQYLCYGIIALNVKQLDFLFF